jgi:hypothetical protein
MKFGPLRRLRLLQASAREFPPKVFAHDEPLDPATQDAVQQLSSQRLSLSASGCLELSPAFDENGAPTPLIDRYDGVPCDKPRCKYRYVVAAVFREPGAAQRSAARKAQYSGGITRYFVAVDFRDAVVVDARDLRFLTEALLRDNDALALSYLRAFRDIGADAIWATGMNSPEVAVIFIEAIDTTIEVSDEALYFFDRESQTWTRLSPNAPESPARKESRRLPSPKPPRRISHWSPRRLITFAVWEMFFATVASLFSDPLLHLLDSDLQVPIWLAAIVAMFFGWFIGRALFHGLQPYRELMREIRSFLVEQRLNASRLETLEQEREFLRREVTRLLEERGDADGRLI